MSEWRGVEGGASRALGASLGGSETTGAEYRTFNWIKNEGDNDADGMTALGGACE